MFNRGLSYLKAAGCQSFSCFCLRVALISNLDESQVIFVGNFKSKNFREMFSLNIDLSLSNWFLEVMGKSQMEFFLTSFLNSYVCSDSCGINLLRYAIISKKRHKSCNWTRTQNHLVLKRTLNHLAKLAKWLSVCLRTKWFWVRVQLQSLHLQISRLLRARSSLTFRQL